MDFKFKTDKLLLSELTWDAITPATWITIGVIVAMILVVAIIAAKREKWTTRMTTNAAICLALSFVLSCIRLFRMPQGGSITPASMLPMMAFAYMYGVTPGALLGLAYGILQFMQGPDNFLSVTQFLLEYPLAFACLSLAGIGRMIGKNAKKGSLAELLSWVVGFVIASIGRYLCHFIAGFVFWGMYAPEGTPAVVYSATYNTFVFADMAICVVIICIPGVIKVLNMMKESSHRKSAAIEEE